MGKMVNTIPNFCLIMRVRPSIQSRNEEKYSDEKKKQGVEDDSGDKSWPSITGRKIMIYADSTVEGRNAVQWALTHTLQNQDTVIFLHVAKPSRQGNQSNRKHKVKVPEFITCMKNILQITKPEVQIEVMVVEAKDKGQAVVAAAKKKGAAMLVVGQKKRGMTWRLMPKSGGDGVAEYCVQNATCMAIAVRRKSGKLGGYVITTKRQKDFWLLA